MADEILKRDQNAVVVASGVTNDSNQEIRMFRIDPTTKRLLISAVITGGGGAVSSVFGRTGAVVAQSGDYTSDQIIEGTKLFFTDERAQDAVGSILSSEFTYDDVTPAISINSIAWSKITGTPTTVAGYGITDALDGTMVLNRIPYGFDSNTLQTSANLTYNGSYLSTPTARFATINPVSTSVLIGSLGDGSYILSDVGNSLFQIVENFNTTSYDGSTFDITGNIKASGLTASRALATNASKQLVSSTTTATELGYLSGVTSAVQTQLDNKQPLDTQLTSLAALSYTSNALKVVRVNAGETDFELATISALTDGDKGDITVSASGATWTIDNDVVTFAKMQNIATDRLLGRDTAASGDTEEITVGGGIEFTGTGGIQTSAFTGDATKTAGGTALTLATVNSNVGSFGSASQVATFTVNGKGLITAASNVSISIASTAVTDFTEAAQDAVGAMVDSTLVYTDATPLLSRAALTGAITASAGSNTTSLGSFTKAQLDTAVSDGNVVYVGDNATNLNMSTARILGRTTAGSGSVEEITVASPLTFTGTTLDFDETATLGNNARVAVSKNSGATTGTRRRLNFIEGTNMTITVVDDAGNEEVDITFDATGGGSGLTHPQVMSRVSLRF